MMAATAGDAAPHTSIGRKRRADDELKNDQRLAKRFDLLNLEQNGKLYVPIEAPLPTPPAASYSPSDTMLVDDTRDRIYIHNLDEELKDIDEEEEKLVFLPDIEKKLGKLPHQLLADDVHMRDKQMVLYQVPESLSVPREKDSVRKAIIESRTRAREEAVRKAEHPDDARKEVPKLAVNGTRVHQHPRQPAFGTSGLQNMELAYDENAMDVE